jgi:hypothetical protein
VPHGCADAAGETPRTRPCATNALLLAIVHEALAGVGWKAPVESEVPVYRQYNPYAIAGAHNYTTSAEEARVLVALGRLFSAAVGRAAARAVCRCVGALRLRAHTIVKDLLPRPNALVRTAGAVP